MNLKAVMTELQERLKTIEGLQCQIGAVDQINEPAAVVMLPEDIDLEAAYRRGLATLDLEVVLAVSRISDRTVVNRLSPFISPGPSSIKTALDTAPGRPATSCDEITTRTVSFEPVMVGDVEYAGAVFTVNIAGSGTS